MNYFCWLPLFLGWVTVLNGQAYLPADTTALFAEIGHRTEAVVQTTPQAQRAFLRGALAGRDSFLRQSVRDSAYLFDAELLPYLEGLFGRIVSTNDLSLAPLVFLDQDYSSNAFSLGQGLFIVNLGLLRTLATEEELLFALCHELAHDQLGHQLTKLRALAGRQSAMAPTLRKLYRPTLFRSQRRQLSLVQDLRDHTYAGYRLQRQAELQADSLALVYFSRLGYATTFAARALGASQRTGVDTSTRDALVELLATEAYPLREDWLTPPPQLFGGGGFGSGGTSDEPAYFWETDSLLTHPALADRQRAMAGYVAEQPLADSLQAGHASGLRDTVDMALLRAHFLHHDYGLALVSALRLLQERPADRRLRELTAEALLGVYRAGEAHDFDEAVPPPEFFADRASQQVVRVLRQMRQSELKVFTLAYLQYAHPAAYAAYR